MRPIAAKGDRPKAGVAGDGTLLAQWPPGHVRGQLGLGLGHLGGALLWEHVLSAPTEPFLWDVCRSLHPAPLLIPRATPQSRPFSTDFTFRGFPFSLVSCLSCPGLCLEMSPVSLLFVVRSLGCV